MSIARQSKPAAQDLPIDKPPRRRRSSPRFKGRRDSVIEAAHELFLSGGYDISLDQVAARAGVSKKTLYNHFGTKLSLLEAVLQKASDAFLAEAVHHETGDLRETLTHYARLYEASSLSPSGIQFYKLFVAHISKFPDMAAAFYASGIDMPVSALARRLQKAVDRGEVRPLDARATAERFIGALTGLVRHRAYAGFGIDSRDQRERYVADTVECFLKGLKAD